GRLLRTRGLRPVSAVRRRNGQPGSRPARSRGRRGSRQRPRPSVGGRGLHVGSWLLRSRPHGRGGRPRAAGALPRRRGDASCGARLSEAGESTGSLRAGLPGARRDRGRASESDPGGRPTRRALTTVFFFFLLHLSLGLLATLPFVPDRAGASYF